MSEFFLGDACPGLPSYLQYPGMDFLGLYFNMPTTTYHPESVHTYQQYNVAAMPLFPTPAEQSDPSDDGSSCAPSAEEEPEETKSTVQTTGTEAKRIKCKHCPLDFAAPKHLKKHVKT